MIRDSSAFCHIAAMASGICCWSLYIIRLIALTGPSYNANDIVVFRVENQSLIALCIDGVHHIFFYLQWQDEVGFVTAIQVCFGSIKKTAISRLN